ncbi:MAG: hypothetical protein U0325_33895 [Polyangiales bacterium]
MRGALSIALGVALFGAAQQLRVDQNHRHDRARRVLDEAQIPRPMMARLVSLGHTEWMVDILWINAMLYYSDTLHARLPSRYLRSYSRTMTELDPKFRQAYLWGALALAYRAANVSTDDLRDAVGLLRQGIAHIPDDPELHGQLGVYLAFELAPHLGRNTDEYRRARAEGAESLRFACESGWGPTWMPLAASNLLTETGRAGAAIDLLQSTMFRAEEAALRQRIHDRLRTLQRAQAGRDDLTPTLRVLDGQRQAEAPWLSPSLYVFIADAPLRRRRVTPAGD